MNGELSISFAVNLYPAILSNDNSPFTLRIYTNALNPVIDLPTISELISFVPS